MKVLVAMSGGVDSSVAAALLHGEGHEVVGLFLRGAGGNDAAEPPGSRTRGCCSASDAADAARTADLLGIPFYAADFAKEFEGLVDGFTAEYLRGRTPNPCILCNRDLKFGRALEYAAALGCEAIATGHYARVDDGPDGRRRLGIARDVAKDQSYVLFPLSQQALARSVFPLAGWIKSDVRAEARRHGLPVAEKPESQDICFVPGGDYRVLLRGRTTEGAETPAALRPGDLVDEDGRRLGSHAGTAGFTVGQRRGLGLAGTAAPLFVTAIDPVRATVTVGPRRSLLSIAARVGGWNPVSAPTPAVGATLRGRARIRRMHEPVPAEARGLEDGGIEVVFDQPVEAATPGQALVLYDEDGWVLGGGWIESARGA
jgi:tRNA-specific 2-thiouridylase